MVGQAPAFLPSIGLLFSVEDEPEPEVEAAPVQVGRGAGPQIHQRIYLTAWDQMYEADTPAEAQKVVKSIKRKAMRRAHQAMRAGQDLPPLPEIKVRGALDMLPDRDVQRDLAAAYAQFFAELDEDDIEVLLL